MSYEAIVVGGGIVGASVAYHLVRDGVETLLVDREDEGRATDAGAGIVSPATSSRTDSEEWFELAVLAADYYPDLADRLSRAVGDGVGYDRPGILSVALDSAGREALEESLSRIRERQERLGRPREGTVEELAPAEARERFPALGEVEAALAYEGAGRVRGRTFAGALRSAALDRGLDLVRESAEGIRSSPDGVEGVATDGGEYDAGRVAITGGAWSGEFGDDLGVSLPVEPQRGQIAHLDVPASVGDTGEWPLLTAEGAGYMVPWPGGELAAGATRETGAGFDARVTAGGVRSVLDDALRVAPGLSEATLSEVRVGLRPRSPDGLPLIGRVPSIEGAFLATGHGPTGLTMGPYSGKVLATLVAGGDPDVSLSAFDPGRFVDRL